MSEPLVSVIMPVYNGQSYLADAINSVLEQDHQHWELLIINDGSTDNSLSIARKYKDPRIKVWSQCKAGVASARNAGLKVMQGDFFCFLDSDDVFTPRSLSARLRCFTSTDITFVDGTVEIYNSDLNVKQRVWMPEKSADLFKSLIRLDNKCFFGPTWMVRKNQTTDYHFHEGLTHGEDLFFYLSYSHLGRYRFTREAILKYRKTTHSAMSNLRGLANGYTWIRKHIAVFPYSSPLDLLIFSLKTRKAMFLDFLKAGEIKSAVKYLIVGSV